MRKTFRTLSLTLSSLALIAAAGMTSVTAEEKKETSVLEEGKAISFDRKKGNCLACHMIVGGDLPGNIGPPLIAMKARFPDKEKLRAQIYDARITNPDTIMIPFGAHGVLTDEEVDKVTEYIHSL